MEPLHLRTLAILAGAILGMSSAPHPADGRGSSPPAWTEELPEAVVFQDDFSTDPNTNGQWTILRFAGDPGKEASWNAGDGTVFLTRGDFNLGTAMFANVELTATRWAARFR